ncbi:unnamed protein product [Ilex paraguariensis]|uniref:Uncharacterized protein n=1 Tax=Ilex paraguariensis TaxID=185542 RepID=A0ABC8U533_9AQUA
MANDIGPVKVASFVPAASVRANLHLDYARDVAQGDKDDLTQQLSEETSSTIAVIMEGKGKIDGGILEEMGMFEKRGNFREDFDTGYHDIDGDFQAKMALDDEARLMAYDDCGNSGSGSENLLRCCDIGSHDIVPIDDVYGDVANLLGVGEMNGRMKNSLEYRRCDNQGYVEFWRRHAGGQIGVGEG